ncbi:hypothetical protein Tco_0168152 [Tanacetum coccineum]
MGSITSLKCVLTQEHLDAICAKYFVPEEVHPQLTSPDATMHERPAGKVGMYTRFFDYANYRIPFSTFFVSVLTHFCVPFSQLSVFGSAKVPILLKIELLPPLNIMWSMLIPLLLKPLRSLEMDLNAFIRTADPRKVRIVERARPENERPIVTVAKHRTVTLLPTSVVRSSGELSASVEREFVGDASVGDGGDQGFDSVGGQDNAEPTVPVTESVETEIPGPKRSKKKRVTRGSERMLAASHPPKRLRADYGTTGGSATGGKPPSVLNRLLQDSRLTVEQGVPALPTLPFITSSVTASPLEEGGDLTDSVTGPSLRTVGPSTRFVVLSDSSQHSGAKSADPEVDSLVSKDKRRVRDGSGFDVGLHSCGGGYRYLFGGNLSARNLSLSSEVRMRAEYNILEKRKWRSLAEEKEVCLGVERIVSGLNELSDLGASSSSLKSRNQNLVNQVHELEISSTNLREKLEMYEGSLKQLEEFQDDLMRPLKTRLAEIDADFTRCCMRFQESFHPHLLNIVAGRRWLLTHGMKLLVVKCLNSTEYMEALGHSFGCAIEKGMQEGLAVGIEHGQAGRCLTDLEAYIPSAEADFNSAIRDLRDLNFPLLQELSNKKDLIGWSHEGKMV